MPEEPRSPSKREPAEGGRDARASAVVDDGESLRERAEAAEKDREEYLSLLRRTRADFENFQKRLGRDVAEEKRYALAELIRDLLPVLDDLRRALDAPRGEEEVTPLTQGVALVLAELEDILRRHGVTAIDPRGKPFDPRQHEAVLMEPRDDVPPGTVVTVLELGYRLHDRILRPAKVVVSAARTEEGA